MSAHIRRAATIGAALLATALIGAGPAFAAPSAPPQPASPSQPTERAAAIARPAVVQLQQTFTGYVADETGDYFNEGNAYELSASCTGFRVDPNGYIATAGHCVDISSAIGVKSVFIGTVAAEVATRLPGVTLEEITEFGTSNWSVEGKQKDSPIDVAISVSVGGTELAARVVDVRPLDQGDVALLKVETTDLPTVDPPPVTSGSGPTVGRSAPTPIEPTRARHARDPPVAIRGRRARTTAWPLTHWLVYRAYFPGTQRVR